MRTVGSSHEKTRKAIRTASLELIFEKGFNATSLRDLAKRVGLQPGSLYNYIKTKEDLLFFLLKETLESRLEELRSRLEEAKGDPVAEIREFVLLNVEFQTERRQEVAIGTTELKSLSAGRYRAIVRIRDKYDTLLTEIIVRGAKKGVFHVPNPRIATFAIIAMMSGIPAWYRPEGRLKRPELAELYREMVFRLLSVGRASTPRHRQS